ncbi:hypothetical protein HUZ36_04380 [Pseudoalteromonas sp. McH1-7]|uniref:hypothetical protein n=1 Tax=Pseudoalteromonas sp. McH1-7 TaxID=2745574 RepID=UPI0015929096|nr:hypothetical protein [Pseudoalteromonas sp. McH1-7]NUZ10009.1 hypothetical protein [Pseudoalteromonas sp. McH1-7]
MKNQSERVYTPREYAENVCHGKVKAPAVSKWIRQWKTQGGLPKNHRIEELPSGRNLIIVTEDRKHTQLLTHLVVNR